MCGTKLRHFEIRFPVLALGMKLTSLTTIRNIIVSCCVLHNIAIDARDELPEVEIEGFAQMLEASQIENQNTALFQCQTHQIHFFRK